MGEKLITEEARTKNKHPVLTIESIGKIQENNRKKIADISKFTLKEVGPNLLEALDAINNEPEKPENHLRLGDIYEKLNQYNKAEDCYKEALKLDPEDPEIFMALGLLYEKMGHPDSEKYINKAIELSGGFTGGGAKRKKSKA